MSELRQDPATKEWVIIAPERAKRPQTIPERRQTDELPNWDESCPFCPGNEKQTPQEVFRLPRSERASTWEVRVVPNQFAALTLNKKTTKIKDRRLFHMMNGIGEHEVIIETPSHNTPMALMTYQQIANVLVAYQERYNTLKNNPQFKFITIFKNYGLASGTSLTHPHSQLVATPITSPYYRRKYDVAVDYYDDVGKCLYCDLIADELKQGRRVVAFSDEFVVLHPYASHVPWETWVIPKTHCASFGLLPATHLAELAVVLRDTLLCLYRSLDNPDFNLMVDTTATEDEENPYYHWHIRIVPRLTLIAGFEMGSGIYVNSALPEDTARLMKQVARSLPEEECLSFRQKG